MKVNAKAIAKTVLILIFFTMLPLLAQQLVPSEFFNAFTMQGFDIAGLSNKIALIGLAIAVLVLLRGHADKPSSLYLGLATAWKFLWLFIIFFVLGLGHPETLGLGTIASTIEHVENSVTFDFRLFAGLATAVVALMVAKSIIEFRDTKPPATVQESERKPA